MSEQDASFSEGGMIIYVDIDGSICTQDGINYESAQPIPERIEKINKLFDRGHKIVYYTARGTGTGKDLKVETANQLREWGVKYHGLEFGKPLYDLFIDDRAINARSIERLK